MKKLAMYFFFTYYLTSCGNSDEKTTPPFDPPSETNLCEVRVTEELLIENPDLDKIEANFPNLQKHVFTQYCQSCHSGPSGYSPDLTDEQDTLLFVIPGEPHNSALYRSIADGRMPPSLNLPQSNPAAVRLLKRWIKSLD